MPRSPIVAVLRPLAVVVAALAGLAAAVLLVFTRSPWPSALLIRRAFDKGGWRTNAALEPLVPAGITSLLDVPYRAGDPDALLDVHRPADAAPGTLPTIVWVHGGGWVAGGKDQTASYLKILAAEGFVVVGIDYSLAPGAHYPEPVHQLCAALAHLAEHRDELGLDLDRVVLAGDSAGAQIAAQVAGAATSPAYADLLGLGVPLPREALRAVVLHCGAYDLSLITPSKDAGGWFLQAVLWSYSGSPRFLEDPRFEGASVAQHVSADFPPAFLTGGNADPLTPQGRSLAAALERAGVPVTALFAEPDAEPPLGHEYQFDLHTDAGREAFTASVAFLQEHTRA